MTISTGNGNGLHPRIVLNADLLRRLDLDARKPAKSVIAGKYSRPGLYSIYMAVSIEKRISAYITP